MAPVRSSTVSNKALRDLAEIDYVTDPEDRPLRYHYERADRDYKEIVAWTTYERWATEGRWVERRAWYFEQIKTRIIATRLDKLVEQRLSEIETLSEDVQLLHEWIRPLRDANGQVKRYPDFDNEGLPHPFAGLPQYAVPFTRMEKAIAAFIALDQHLMLKRGEATSRSDNVNGPARPSVLDPQKMLSTVSKEEVQAMARALLLKRQPELLQQPVVDIEPERGAEDEGGNTI